MLFSQLMIAQLLYGCKSNIYYFWGVFLKKMQKTCKKTCKKEIKNVPLHMIIR